MYYRAVKRSYSKGCGLSRGVGAGRIQWVRRGACLSFVIEIQFDAPLLSQKLVMFDSWNFRVHIKSNGSFDEGV